MLGAHDVPDLLETDIVELIHKTLHDAFRPRGHFVDLKMRLMSTCIVHHQQQ